jgi:hypothetical protein
MPTPASAFCASAARLGRKRVLTGAGTLAALLGGCSVGGLSVNFRNVLTCCDALIAPVGSGFQIRDVGRQGFRGEMDRGRIQSGLLRRAT